MKKTADTADIQGRLKMQDMDNAGPGKWRTMSQGMENAGPTKMTEQIAGLTMQGLDGKTLHLVANITNILSRNYSEQVM